MTDSDSEDRKKIRALTEALESSVTYRTELEEQLEQAYDEISRLREELEGRW